MALSKNAERSLHNVVTRFEQGDVGPLVAVAGLGLDESAPARGWTYSNRTMAYATTGSLDARTFKQWEAAGRKVTERGCGYILGPKTYTVENDDGERETRLAGFYSIPVFGYDKTKAVEDDAFVYEPPEPPPLADVAERFGVALTYEPLPWALGATVTDGSAIKMGAHDAYVFFHELAHAADARLNGKLTGGQYADQETRAELTAAVLASMYGRARTGDCWQYVSHYAPDDPLKAIREAANEIGPILELILKEDETDDC